MFARHACLVLRPHALPRTAVAAAAIPRRWPVRPIPAMRTFATSLNVRAPSNGNGSSSKHRQPTPVSSLKSTKRRQALASQGLRSNPSPSRGPILECISYTTAERYDLTQLAFELRRQGVVWDTAPEGHRNDQAIVISSWGRAQGNKGDDDAPLDYESVSSQLDPTIEAASTVSNNPFLSNQYATYAPPTPYQDAIPSAAPRQFEQGQNGEIWVFKSGSFVTWGLSAAEGRSFLREVIRNPSGNIEISRHGEVQTEEVDFVVDPTEETLIRGNLVLLGRPPQLETFPPSKSYASLLTRYTLSLALARSSALSAIEAKLDAHLESVARVPHMLEVWGKQPLKRTEVIRKIGELMVLREAVNFRGGGLEETPEIYWSEPQLEGEQHGVVKGKISQLQRKRL